MPHAIPCAYCNEAPVDTVRRVWFMRGYLVFARYGSRHLVGCRSCVREQVQRMLIRNAIAGWWSFPWGLGNPVVLGQNLLQIADKPEEEEERRLEAVGLDFNPATT